MKYKLFSAIVNIFEKIAVIRTRQALTFLSDQELDQMGINRQSLVNGDFYNYKDIKDFPRVSKSNEKITSEKAA